MKIKDLSRPEKMAVAQQLSDEGYSTRTIEEFIGADHTTISRWIKQQSPEEMQQFATRFLEQVNVMKNIGLVKAVNRINELVPKSRSIQEVIQAAEFLEGKKNGGQQTNVQVNFGKVTEKDKETYGEL